MEQLKKDNEEKYPILRHFNFFFYVVLDNVKGIMKIERQKKILEKLSITQSLLS